MGSKSSSSKASNVHDERVGADNGSLAFRENTGSVIIGSDELASQAIDQVTQNTFDTLTASTDFIAEAFNTFLNFTDKRIDRADANVAATTQFTGDILKAQQETSDDRLIKIVQFAMIAGVGVVALQSGVFKDIAGAFR